MPFLQSLQRSFSIGRSKRRLPPQEVVLDNQTKKNTTKERQSLRYDFSSLLVSILDCDFVWWEIKSESQLQRCHCARPSQQERLFGAVGQCCLCVKKWSKSQCDKFRNAPPRQWRHHRHPPQLDLFAVCHNKKNSKFSKSLTSTSLFSSGTPLPGVTECLHGVSAVIHIPSHWNATMMLPCG